MAAEVDLDLGEYLGAESDAFEVLALYIPDRDRLGKEIGNQRQWVLEGANLLCRIGGGVTIEPAVEGGWYDEVRDATIWECPIRIFTYIKPEAFERLLPELKAFVRRLGRETNQGEVAVELADVFYRIREFS